MKPLPGVVVRSNSIVGGPVVRWFWSVDHADVPGQPVISASRIGVRGNGYLSPELFQLAWSIHQRLDKDPEADLSDVVTHAREDAFAPLIRVPVRAVVGHTAGWLGDPVDHLFDSDGYCKHGEPRNPSDPCPDDA